MISKEKELQIRDLLKNPDNSTRQISKLVVVARATVDSIKNGTFHSAYEKNREELKKELGDCITPDGELVRCPVCGYMVQMPCLSCFLHNGYKYPKEVLDVMKSKNPIAQTRKCIVCGKVKTNDKFSDESTKSLGVLNYSRICNECSRLEYRRKRDCAKTRKYDVSIQSKVKHG